MNTQQAFFSPGFLSQEFRCDIGLLKAAAAEVDINPVLCLNGCVYFSLEQVFQLVDELGKCGIVPPLRWQAPVDVLPPKPESANFGKVSGDE